MAVEQLQKFTNNATTTVPGTISNVATSIVVNTGTGALFPVLSGSLFFAATIVNTISSDPGFGQLEIVKVTARTADTMTIERAQEGTTAKSFPAGCLFELRPTAQAFDNIYTEVLELESTKAPIASPVFTGNPQAPTPTLGDDDTSIATTGFARDAFEAYGDRHVNIIINPFGTIQQAAGSSTTSNTYFADQWLSEFAAASAAFQASTQTGSVSNYDPNYLEIKTTTAKASLAAGDFSIISQRLEGNYFRRFLYGGSTAKGSWIRWRASSTQSGTASIAIRNASTNRSFVQSFAVTTTPTDYSLFVPGDTTGTWPVTNVHSATISFVHAAGTTYQTSTLGAWQAGNLLAATTQSNMLDTVNRALHVTDVQWTDSPILLPFQSVDYQQELARCQRYYCKTFDQGVFPADNTGNQAGALFVLGAGSGNQSAYYGSIWYFPVTMRTTPSVATYNYGTGGAGLWRNANGGGGSAPSGIAPGDSKIHILLNGGAAVTLAAQDAWYIHVAASARM